MNSNETYSNLSSEYTLTERILIGIVFSTICVTGVLGNLFVLYVAIRKQNYKYVTNCYIINLAITDLLFLSVSVPLTIYLGLTDSWMLSNLIDCKTQLLIAHVLLQTTCYTLAVMSIDRYLYVRGSHPRPKWRTPTNAFLICILIWIVSISFMFPYKSLIDSKTTQIKSSNDCTLLTLNPLFSSCYFTFFAFYILPLLIIAFCYTKLCFYMRNVRKTIYQYQNCLNGRNRSRVTRTLFSLTCAFAICWFPIHLLELLNCRQMLDRFYLKHSSFLNVIRITAHALSYFNSCLNPVLYALYNKDFFI